MSCKNVLSLLYTLLVIFSLLLITIIANHLYASTIDGHFNGFFKTAIQSLKLNYYVITGRWAQGLTFDYRLQTNTVISTTLNSMFLVFSMYYLLKQLFKKQAIIVTAVCYFSFFYSAHNLYQVTHLLNTALSYTFGLSLIFLFFGIYIKHPKPKFKTMIISVLLLFVSTGLVEHLFVIVLLILGYLVFEDVIYSIKIKKFKFNIYTIIYLVVTLAGSLLVVFSPGSIRRRERTSKRLETSEYSGNFDFTKYFEALNRELIDQLNISSLLFFVVILVVVFMLIKKQGVFSSKLNLKIRFSLLLLFSIALVVTPITVGFIASNGKVGMPKAYNLTVILFLFFLVVLAYTLNVIFKIKFNKTIVNVIQIYYSEFLHTLVFQTNNLFLKKKFKTLTITVDQEVLKIKLDAVLNSKQMFYTQNSNYVAIVIPRGSKKMEVKELPNSRLNLLNENIKDKITYKFNYGNLM
ncbi:DUF6056 family protein [Olleya namhaensis]|uniref:Glucosyl transferase GtrII n=1 Tax=Olleya namhaensis TaxID=1144750 RepID=A0A1I3JP11_9FLAO|nr:DUF6056 family protein [Olleya namhaensis]SFI62009.1 hypothetical protein SAMN05443431_101490 [Olleya namhaensis]